MTQSLKASLLVFAIAAVWAAPSSHAEEMNAPSTESPAPKAKSRSKAHDPLATLNLTPEQQKQIDAVRKDEKFALDSLKTDPSLSKEDKKSRTDEIKASHHAQIRAVLTPEQQVKFDALPPAHSRKKAE